MFKESTCSLEITIRKMKSKPNTGRKYLHCVYLTKDLCSEYINGLSQFSNKEKTQIKK